ncbi:MAG: hypothetical protein MNPFHGCM_01821 [Gemmatimonadaceae bacterium]|nr:hypothetical protein [Gemmatimonadaceae bacterium]
MSVSGVNGANKLTEPASGQGPRRPNVKALRAALQAGDVDAAKEAFAKVYRNVKKAPTAAVHDGVAANLKRLVIAVDAGNVTDAQKALESLDAEREGIGYAPGQVPGVVRQAGKDFLTLVQAIRSGDASAAGSALDQLRDGVRLHFHSAGDRFKVQPTEPFEVQPMRREAVR